METQKTEFKDSITVKGIIIAVLILLLLIPNTMIKGLINERQARSRETIQKINDKWSHSQTLCAPLLIIPYTTAIFEKDTTKSNAAVKTYYEKHKLYLTPKDLKIDVSLSPEERYYGIYKAILYKSDIHFNGSFDLSELSNLKINNSKFHFDDAQIVVGITDLRGITQNPDLKIDGEQFEMSVGTINLFYVSQNVDENYYNKFIPRDYNNETVSGKTLVVNMNDITSTDSFNFECSMKLNGSSSINFIPVGQNTSVSVSGEWRSPSFTGSFSPKSDIDDEKFSANWNVLSFNRDIPKMWSDNNAGNLANSSFGVNLIQTVDNYQQNMRSAKYSLMFIILTFIVFFFVEIFTKKPIHFFQYVLVGTALIIFYSLLLSLSEQIGFGFAYLTASAATILMTTVYLYSLIKQKSAAFILAGIMIILYAFLYIILQIEDFALLFGSIFLFVILGIIMFVSNKIQFEKSNDEN